MPYLWSEGNSIRSSGCNCNKYSHEQGHGLQCCHRCDYSMEEHSDSSLHCISGSVCNNALCHEQDKKRKYGRSTEERKLLNNRIIQFFKFLCIHKLWNGIKRICLFFRVAGKLRYIIFNYSVYIFRNVKYFLHIAYCFNKCI